MVRFLPAALAAGLIGFAVVATPAVAAPASPMGLHSPDTGVQQATRMGRYRLMRRRIIRQRMMRRMRRGDVPVIASALPV